MILFNINALSFPRKRESILLPLQAMDSRLRGNDKGGGNDKGAGMTLVCEWQRIYCPHHNNLCIIFTLLTGVAMDALVWIQSRRKSW